MKLYGRIDWKTYLIHEQMFCIISTNIFSFVCNARQILSKNTISRLFREITVKFDGGDLI